MFLYKVLTFILIFHIVKSEDKIQCNNLYKDITTYHPIIDINEYCNNKLCISKCCGAGEFINSRGLCIASKTKRKLHAQINYANINLYSWDGDVKVSQKKLTDLAFVQNGRFVANNSDCFYEYPSDTKFYILEDGSLKMPYNNKQWMNTDKLSFCVEYKIIPVKKNNTIKAGLGFILREILDTAETEEKKNFTVIAMIISIIFMVLVLVVYGSLRQLRNISGLMLMAYVCSLLVTYVLKVVMVLATDYLTAPICKRLAPVFYFSVLSSFFWLNIMSFDIWWTLRGHCICRDIHRQGETVKFLWYCLYAWGSPLLITIIVVVLDNIDLEHLPFIMDPSLRQCFSDDNVLIEYIYKPIGVIIVVNIIFFLMTTYNIWLIKRMVNNNQESRNTKKDTNRFFVYLKLSVIMGLGWILELLPDVSLVWYIVININNMLVGAIIFFLFVFKKRVLIMFCKRYGILKEYIARLENYQSGSKSGVTGNTDTSSTFKFKRQTKESKC